MDVCIGYLMDVLRWIIVTILGLVLPGDYAPWTGQVIEVIRPDELRVVRGGKEERVRLYGIDSPIWWKDQQASAIKKPPKEEEEGKPELRVKDCRPLPEVPGDEAHHYVSYRVLGRAIRVQPIPSGVSGTWYHPSVRLRDQYGRIIALAWVYGESGQSLSDELLKKGLAWWYEPFVPFERGYKAMEDKARDERVGVWAKTAPVSPWSWQCTPVEEATTAILWIKRAMYAAAAGIVAIAVMTVIFVFRRVSRMLRRYGFLPHSR
jgi:endonuclease YncB( thermonuclease family)